MKFYQNFLTFTVSNGNEVSVTNCNPDAIDVIIPDEIVYDKQKYTISSIGEGAFYGCYKLNSVSIPDTVTSIHDIAFLRCVELTELKMSEKIEFIGDRAFAECWKLTSKIMLNNIKHIGSSAFYLCTQLPSICIRYNSDMFIASGAFSYVKHIICDNDSASEFPWGATSANGYIENGFIYSDTTKKDLQSYIGNNEVVVIPNTVTSINDGAFAFNESLISVIIPDTVSHIGKFAFTECYKLRFVKLPNNLTIISEGVFNNCSKLEYIDIPKSITSIGKSAFHGTNINTIELPESVTSIGSDAFSATKIKEIVIPNECIFNEDAEGMFYLCKFLEKVVLPDNISIIPNHTFGYCENLKDINIPDTVKIIGMEAFSDCYNLFITKFPDNLIEIRDYAFSRCPFPELEVPKNAVYTDNYYSFYEKNDVDDFFKNKIINNE